MSTIPDKTTKEEIERWLRSVLGRNDPSTPEYRCARALLQRLDHDDIISEIERRNNEGNEIEVLFGIGLYTINTGKLVGPSKPTIKEAWQAFKAGEK